MSSREIVLACDPGYMESALVWWDGEVVRRHVLLPNEEVLAELVRERHRGDTDSQARVLVVEQIESMGMPVGTEVFETVFWSGQFVQAWKPGRWDRVTRHAVKLHLCGQRNAKDANVRQALIDRFGPTREKAVGTRHAPGPLYGVTGHCWAATAVAVTWLDHTSKNT